MLVGWYQVFYSMSIIKYQQLKEAWYQERYKSSTKLNALYNVLFDNRSDFFFLNKHNSWELKTKYLSNGFLSNLKRNDYTSNGLQYQIEGIRKSNSHWKVKLTM